MKGSVGQSAEPRSLTEHFTVSEPQYPLICNFYTVQKRGSAELEAPKNCEHFVRGMYSNQI